MAAMRVSLVARFVSHPTIIYSARRRVAQRARLGLPQPVTVYHRTRRGPQPAVAALRARTSGYHFPSVGRIGRIRARRAALTLGLPRARRA